MNETLTEPAKLLLLASLLSKDRLISNNGKAFLKELVLRRDPRLSVVLNKFESKQAGDAQFLEQIHALIEEDAFALFQDLYSECSLEHAKTLSKTERDHRRLQDEKSLIYGEIEFGSFARVLRKINPPPGALFYDLGSGAGRAVFAARLTHDFGRCVGIEILEALHNAAMTVVERYNKEFRHYLCATQPQHAQVFNGSFLKFDWSDGDVVFANSTCFDDDLMDSLSIAAERLKPGAFVITFTKGLSSDKFEVLERKRYKMSWGPATVFIHRRLNPDGTPVGPANLNTLPSDAESYVEEDDLDDLNADYGQDDGQDDDGMIGGTGNRNYDDDEQELEDDEDEEQGEEEEGGEDAYQSDEAEEEPEVDEDGPEEVSGFNSPSAAMPSSAGDRRLGLNPRMMALGAGGQEALFSPQDSALLRRKRASHRP